MCFDQFLLQASPLPPSSLSSVSHHSSISTSWALPFNPSLPIWVGIGVQVASLSPLPKENWLSFPSSHQLAVAPHWRWHFTRPSPSGLISCRFGACSHTCCELTPVRALSYSVNSVWLHMFSPGSYTLSVSSSVMIPEPWGSLSFSIQNKHQGKLGGGVW